MTVGVNATALFGSCCLVFLGIFFNFSHGASVPVCTGINYNMSVISQTTNETVIIYNGGISLSPGDNIHTVVQITNHTIWSTDNSLYFQSGPIQYYDIEQGMLKCPSLSDGCNLTVFDGNGYYEIPLMLNGQELDVDLTVFMNFDQGTVYNNDFGLLFDPNVLPCSSMETFVIVGPAYNMIFYYCCNNFNYVDVPDENLMCTEFQGNSTLFDSSGNVLGSLTADYQVRPLGMTVTVTNATLPAGGSFDLNPNDDTNGCNGDSSNPTCSLFYEVYPTYDYQVDMILYFGQDENTIGTTMAGKIIKRGQTILRDLNKPYTQADPCWSGTFPASQTSDTAQNSFCCTKFEAPPTGTTCAEYRSVTQVESQQSLGPYLQMKYLFTNSTLNVNVLNFTNSIPSNVQFESYSTDTFSQICQANTSSPTNACSFKLSSTNQYDFKFRTSDFKDGFEIITINEVNSQLTDPSLIPANPCYTEYNYDSTQTYVAMSQLCCIAQPNGPWPGSMKFEPNQKYVFKTKNSHGKQIKTKTIYHH